MKLIYRSTTYDYNHSPTPSRPFQPVRTTGPAYHLSYRGLTYRVDPNARPTEVPVLPTAYKLTYRGIAYFVDRTATGEVTIVTQSASTPNLQTKAFPNQALPN